MTATKGERFAEFLQRLKAASPARDAAEALALLSSMLTSVEDELTSIPNNPDSWESDGRLYPPKSDSARDVPGRDDVTRYRSRAHNTFIGAAGEIRIESTSGVVLLNKPGASGKCL